MNLKIMKIIFASMSLALAITLSVGAADATVTITDVHLCCQSCVKGVAKAAANVLSLIHI